MGLYGWDFLKFKISGIPFKKSGHFVKINFEQLGSKGVPDFQNTDFQWVPKKVAPGFRSLSDAELG
jgi:hypothetical protein